jgi:hypothetical protein
MSFRRSRVAAAAVVAVVAASTLFGVLPSTGAGAGLGGVDPADRSAATRAAAWLVQQQEPDGGFELADFPGFETPDAVLAIAEAAQTGASWSKAEARAVIEGLQYGGPGGPTPIDALDDWVTAGINSGEASKILALVVEPLGLDPGDFGTSNTDLAALVYPSGCGAAPVTDEIFFYEKMFVGYGGELLCGAPDPAIVTMIRDAQRLDGGWNFNGSTAAVDPDDPFDPNLPDVDTTAVAMQVLVAAGAAWNDPAILRGLAYLAGQQSADGAFPSFGADDPNATAVAMLAITAAGFDPDRPCWRQTAVPGAAPTGSPGAWLRAQQLPDGRIASPNDSFGVNTFATSQTVEALLRSWLPLGRATGAPTCGATPPPNPPANPGGAPDPIALVPRFTG